MSTPVADLRKIRTRVHAVLAAALIVSVAANVTAAAPTWTGRAVAAWPPIALLLIVDVLGKAPVAAGWLGRLSVAAAGLVALVAAVASFSHMRHVAQAAGESELVAVLFPLSVDGCAVVCSIALVEINRRLKIGSVPEEPPPASPHPPEPVTHLPARSTTTSSLHQLDAVPVLNRSHGPTNGVGAQQTT